MNKPNKVISWYGWLPDRPDQRDLYYTAIAAPPKRMPSSVDLRAGCSTVENQGQLGSCTANALAGSLEFLEKKIGKPATDLSRLFIYYNERAHRGQRQPGFGRDDSRWHQNAGQAGRLRRRAGGRMSSPNFR